MEVVDSNSRSLWEDSQITPEVSVQVSENVEGFQQCVNEILKLIEQEGSFSEMTEEIFVDKKSKLSTRVAELSRMHSALADQHVHLIGEVSKNCPSLIKKPHLDSSDSSSPKVTQMFTPDQMSNTHKFRTPIGFDVFSSGGGGSYASRNEASESSFSISSDSESESFMPISKLLISPVNGDSLKVKEPKVSEALLEKISNLEEELVTLNKKLQSLTDENSKLKHEIQENESDKCTLNADLETENAKVIELQKEVADLKGVISDSNLKVKTMEQELEASSEKLSTAEDEISKLNNESSKIFEQTRWLEGQLGSTQQELDLLQKLLDFEKDKNLGLQEEVSLCVADISVRDDQITELNTRLTQSLSEILLLKNTHEAKEDTWKADFERVKTEVREKCQSVDNLNKSLDALKLQRDGVTAQLDTLRAEKRSQDNLAQELETRLNSLQVEHELVLSLFDNAQKVTNELNLKVVELEREVDRQKEVISDRAEEKREAIRQLSFSLEHYMSGYKELRQAFVGNKRRAVLTS